MGFIDRISDWCGRLSGWLFFIIAVIVTYEVVARYVFHAPTIWAEELSLFGQIWATYLGASYVLRHRDLIKIDILSNYFGAKFNLFSELLSLVVIAVFSIVTVFYSLGIVIDSIALNRSSATMLSLPLWLTESAIPIGFTLLTLQCVSEFFKVLLLRKESEL